MSLEFVMNTFSIIIPTYRRPETLELCLTAISELEYDPKNIEVIVLDNANDPAIQQIAERCEGRVSIAYVGNEVNRGYGGSVNRGLAMCSGDRIVILNDDAILPADFLLKCNEIFQQDPRIGCVGVRALEDNYAEWGSDIGTIDAWGDVIGNFCRDPGELRDVEHVYGFCYVITRQALDLAGTYDHVLLAKPYSTGNRTETDHCLAIRRSGLRVVYEPRISVRHLAKPRVDYEERSHAWMLNDTRNTLYMLLKHFGFFGRRGVALRYCVSHNVGIRSLILHPSWNNLVHFTTGARARLSALCHYLVYLLQFERTSRR